MMEINRKLTWQLYVAIMFTFIGYVFAYLARDGNVHIFGFPVFMVRSGKMQEGAIEYLEAIFWLSAFLLYFHQLIKSFGQSFRKSVWLAGFTLLCFVALGEELSWGQHVFGFETPNTFGDINNQGEVNIHNINAAKILGLEQGTFLERRLNNITKLLNPLFSFFCLSVWVFVPLVLRKNKQFMNNILAGYPEFGRVTIWFLAVNTLIYVIVDQLFFDVGEIFELVLPLTAWLSILEARRSEN